MKKEYDFSKMKQRKPKVYTKEEIQNATIKVAINIRVDFHDLEGVQKEADRMGIPYQTLINSVLHRFVTGELVDKPKKKTGT